MIVVLNFIRKHKKSLNYTIISALVFSVILFSLAFFFKQGLYNGEIDGWFAHTLRMKEFLLGNVSWFEFFEEPNYQHAFTPGYHFLTALLDMLINNVYTTRVVFNIACFLLSNIFIIMICNELKIDKNALFMTITMPILLLDAVGLVHSYSFILFAAIFYMYSTIRLIHHNKGIVLGIVSGTILFFSREINWALFLFPIIYSISYSVKNHREKLFFSRTWNTISSSILIPSVFYLSFLLLADIAYLIPERIQTLHLWDSCRNVNAFLITALLSYTTLPILILIRLKKLTWNCFPLLLISGIMLISRLIAPGPFWPHYFETSIVPLSLVVFNTLNTSNKSRIFILITIGINVIISVVIYLDASGFVSLMLC